MKLHPPRAAPVQPAVDRVDNQSSPCDSVFRITRSPRTWSYERKAERGGAQKGGGVVGWGMDFEEANHEQGGRPSPRRGLQTRELRARVGGRQAEGKQLQRLTDTRREVRRERAGGGGGWVDP